MTSILNLFIFMCTCGDISPSIILNFTNFHLSALVIRDSEHDIKRWVASLFCMAAFFSRVHSRVTKFVKAECSRQAGSLLRDVRHIRADGWHRINGIIGLRERSQACTSGLPIYLRRKYVYIKRKKWRAIPAIKSSIKSFTRRVPPLAHSEDSGTSH